MKQAGSGKRHSKEQHGAVLRLYRQGYRQDEIERAVPAVPQSTVNRWVKAAIRADPALEVAHFQGDRGRMVGVPVPVWEAVRESITLFDQDAVTGEVQRAPGVYAAAGTHAEIHAQLLQQQREAGDYIEPKYNLPFLMKCKLEGLGYRRIAQEYRTFTKRTISVSTVRRLLKDIIIEAPDPEGKAVLLWTLQGDAESEEWLRAYMKSAKPAVVTAVPRHPIQRVTLIMPKGMLARHPVGSAEFPTAERSQATSGGTGSP